MTFIQYTYMKPRSVSALLVSGYTNLNFLPTQQRRAAALYSKKVDRCAWHGLDTYLFMTSPPLILPRCKKQQPCRSCSPKTPRAQ